ncbi:hypothetical protein EJ03DRAFT_147761 [Teratosphaeria nubilosa]|uniref:Uncharacterized protein n=1 Tax=Teratosphaeria nubilosa TaxID=161662 RepID=A0A6G1L4A6_9PEZI|nr:hypothetical protein EJ03DRAFT_147761 [Teratosphaeria nubilosa]
MSFEDRNKLVAKDLWPLLAWLIHAEGKAEAMWDWLIAEAKAFKRTRAPGVERLGEDVMRWSVYALGGMIGAYIARAPDGTINIALRQINRAFAIFGPAKSLCETVPVIGGITAVRKAAQTIDCPPCDPALYDEFVGIVLDVQKCRTRHFAILKLYHPTQPDPLPFYYFMVSDHQRLYETGLPKTMTGDKSWHGSTILRTAYMLRLQGDHPKAEWLENLVSTYHVAVWLNRDKVLWGCGNDPKLKSLQDAAMKESWEAMPWPIRVGHIDQCI